MLALIKKLIKIIIIMILALIFLGLKSFAIIEKPTTDIFVVDKANVLSEEVKQEILATSTKLDEVTTAQVVVVVVNNLEGRDIESYSTELFRAWGIGDSKKNNGVLFILSIEDRRVRIEVGYGLEGILPDGKTGRILDTYVVPHFSSDDWNEGIIKGYRVIVEQVEIEYGITDLENAKYKIPEEDSDEAGMIFFIFYIIFMVSMIIPFKSKIKGIIMIIIGGFLCATGMMLEGHIGFIVFGIIIVIVGFVVLRFGNSKGGSSGGGSSRWFDTSGGGWSSGGGSSSSFGGGSSGGGGSSRSF